MKVGYSTDAGREREINEDCLYVDEDMGLFIVADGMGGHKAGRVASKMAVEVMPGPLKHGLAAGKEEIEVIKATISKANEVIYEGSRNNKNWSGMGTTVVLALFRGNHVLIAHVGDSRAYMINNGEIKQLTEDHSKVAEMVKEGQISREQALTHKLRSVITRALGMKKEVGTEIAAWSWDGGECLLLCSDGLTDMLEDREMLAIVKSANGLQEACDNLVGMANEKGGKDNITVILIE